jgi:hypothetical protein
MILLQDCDPWDVLCLCIVVAVLVSVVAGGIGYAFGRRRRM